MAKRCIHGFHAITARLRQNPRSIQMLYLGAARNDPRMRELQQLAELQSVKTLFTEAERLNAMSGHARHQGVVAEIDPSRPIVDIDDVLDNIGGETPFLLVLDGVTDPHNLGACLRVADGMGVHAVIAPKDRAVGLNATVEKVACGAADTVPYLMVTNLARTLRELKDRGIWIAGTAAEADQTLFTFEETGPLAWVLGSEGNGMRRLTRELCDFMVSIPMFGTVESLNVSVATGMCLAATQRARTLKK